MPADRDGGADRVRRNARSAQRIRGLDQELESLRNRPQVAADAPGRPQAAVAKALNSAADRIENDAGAHRTIGGGSAIG